jgi:hypothetical protein
MLKVTPSCRGDTILHDGCSIVLDLSRHALRRSQNGFVELSDTESADSTREINDQGHWKAM